MKTLSILFVLFFYYYGIATGNGDQSAGPGQPTEFSVMSFSSLWLMELEENYKTEGNGYIFGYTIPSHFCGTAEAFNRFPTDQSSLNEWHVVLSRFLHGASILQSEFVYEDETQSWPLYVYYLIYVRKIKSPEIIDTEIYYGRIVNEHSTNFQHDQPYIQVIERSKNFHINLSCIQRRFGRIFKTVELNSFKNYSGYYYNKAAESPESNLLHCSQAFPNVKEFLEFPEDFSSIDQLKKEFIKKPMAIYHSGTAIFTEGCSATKGINIRSAITLNTCMRLFEHWPCQGLSKAFYPKIKHSVIPILGNFPAVGRCLDDEFTKIRDPIQNYSTLPDIIVLYEPTPYKSKFHIPGMKIRYRLGRQSRIEGIQANIKQFGLVRFQDNFKGNVFDNPRYRKKGYIPEYAIPLAIGGPSNMSFNIFPIKKSRVEDWAKIFPSSFSDLHEYIGWNMTLKFAYDTD
ncbi:unnamed protein product [Allacma fusca]|uniref:Uncharacterized protein n=1 Tax=Allacma fusca TaxID=39272 RepID=A0A8J2J5B5_9HEXA|nr:unnamed protein product [Allacma fusca]